MRYCMSAILAVLIIAGCSRPPKQMADAEKLVETARAAVMAGQTNAAIASLVTAMEDPTFKPFRVEIYNGYLGIMLGANRHEEVRAQYLNSIGKDEQIVRSGFGMLSDYARNAGEEAYQGWITTLLNKPMPRDLLEQVFSWQFGIYQSKGQMDQVAALFPVCRQKLDMATAQRLAQGAASAQIDAQKYENAHMLLDAVDKEFGSDAGIKYFVNAQRVRVLFLQDRWDDGRKKFMEISPGLNDDQVLGCLNQAVSYCNEKQKYDLANELCEYVLDNHKDKGRCRIAAANLLISQARTRKDIGAIPVYMESMKAKGLPSEILFDITWDCFYVVIQDGTKEQLAAMVSFADKLYKELKDSKQQAMLKTFILDGAFVLDDQDRVVKILEEGIEGRDSNWHAMHLDKARGHQALKAGKNKEAAAYFRKFMQGLDKWYKPDRDPCSGLLYSKEMCLGFNAKRIGKILCDAGDSKGSEEAYEEARNYYKKAIADLKPESGEAKLVNKEVEGIPEKKNL